jgi:ABC-type branched-subunit amino acid transport system ATPase component
MYVDAGEIVGLIGPNGAGKTTLFEIISGFTRPSSGGVMFLGSDVSRLGPTTRARRGLGRTFQSAQLFPSLTVLETVMMALGRGRASHDAARARELLDEFGILEHRHVVVGNLPTGLRRVLEMTCAFAARPSLVLLDEPTAGLSSAEREDFAQNVLAWRERTGIGIVIIEHDLGILNKVCDRLIAMNLGRKIAEGRPDDVCRHPDVVASYTG